MSKKIKAIIADDEQINVKILTKYLTHLNCEVTTFDNGQAVINELQNNCYHLLIIDVHMPILNGYDTISTIKQDKICHNMKVYILSADPHLEESTELTLRGIDGVLIKPINFEKLQGIIAKIKDT